MMSDIGFCLVVAGGFFVSGFWHGFFCAALGCVLLIVDRIKPRRSE